MTERNLDVTSGERTAERADAGFSRRRLLKLTGAGIVGAAVATGTTSAASDDLSTTIVFDGTDTSGPAGYEFAVTGSIEPHGDVGALESSDTVDGARAVGSVDGDVDAYRFGGDITELNAAGAIEVSLSYPGPEPDANRLEIVSAPDGSLSYAFRADGEVEKVLDFGDNSAEETNDTITDNGDGTWTAEGFTGEGYGDTYDLHGDVLEFQPVRGDYTLFLDGEETSLEDLTGQVPTEEPDEPEMRTIQILTAERSANVEYGFATSGEIEKVLDNGDNSAEENNDTISDNGDGTWTATGLTGEGYGDTYRFAGEVTDFTPMEGPFELSVDGERTTTYELLGVDEPTDEPADEPDAEVQIPFDDESSIQEFSSRFRTDEVSIVDGDWTRNGSALCADIPADEHYGAAMRYRFADEGMSEPDSLFYRYHVYFPEDFDVVRTGGKLPGPAGTYDSAGWGGRTSDGSNGWSARMAFDQGSDDDHVQLGWYCYHADMGNWGNIWDWTNGDRGNVRKGQWHRVDGQVTLNTPGENDGVLRGWVGGDVAHEKTDICFRDTSDLKVQDFWFNVYYGGSWSSPSDNRIFFDDLQLSRGSSI